MGRHLCHRLQRGFMYCEMEDLWEISKKSESWRKTLVISGGVGANQTIKGYIRKVSQNYPGKIKHNLQFISKVCERFDCDVTSPPPRLCTDNGVMIAWNGLEKVRRGLDIVRPEDAFDLDIASRAPLGIDISNEVAERNIKCSWTKIL